MHTYVYSIYHLHYPYTWKYHSWVLTQVGPTTYIQVWWHLVLWYYVYILYTVSMDILISGDWVCIRLLLVAGTAYTTSSGNAYPDNTSCWCVHLHPSRSMQCTEYIGLGLTMHSQLTTTGTMSLPSWVSILLHAVRGLSSPLYGSTWNPCAAQNLICLLVVILMYTHAYVATQIWVE